MIDLNSVMKELKKAVVGKDSVLVKALITILAGGHILLEDIPGVGKTTMALAFSQVLGMEYKRMQFTPDVLPSDITGYMVYNNATGEMRYQPGTAMCNLFLADELNRATSRTQSALLEVMEEGRVTVDGVTRQVPDPFCVIATQNPAGAKGTQLLPDSQMDRFMTRLSLGYPEHDDEVDMLRLKGQQYGRVRLTPMCTLEELRNMRAMVQRVYTKNEILEYIVDLVTATRTHTAIIQGASPRGAIALMSISTAVAFAHGRDYVVPDDVRSMFMEVMSHRLIWTPEAESGGHQEKVLNNILQTTGIVGGK